MAPVAMNPDPRQFAHHAESTAERQAGRSDPAGALGASRLNVPRSPRREGSAERDDRPGRLRAAHRERLRHLPLASPRPTVAR